MWCTSAYLLIRRTAEPSSRTRLGRTVSAGDALSVEHEEKNEVGPEGLEPPTKGLCVPATTFAAPFGFVVWTVSSLYVFAVQSLHLPQMRLGSGLAYPFLDLAFPEFDEFYQGPHAVKTLATQSKQPCDQEIV